MMYNQSFAVGQNVVTDCGCYAMDENDKEHYVEESCAGVVVEVGENYTLVDFGGHRIAMFDEPAANIRIPASVEG
jgi:hypothetical protein